MGTVIAIVLGVVAIATLAVLRDLAVRWLAHREAMRREVSLELVERVAQLEQSHESTKKQVRAHEAALGRGLRGVRA